MNLLKLHMLTLLWIFTEHLRGIGGQFTILREPHAIQHVAAGEPVALHITVKAISPKVKVKWFVKENETLSFQISNCNCTSPESVYWTYSEAVNDDKVFNWHIHSKLIISTFTASHSRKYFCKVTFNRRSIKSSIFELLSKNKPDPRPVSAFSRSGGRNCSYPMITGFHASLSSHSILMNQKELNVSLQWKLDQKSGTCKTCSVQYFTVCLASWNTTLTPQTDFKKPAQISWTKYQNISVLTKNVILRNLTQEMYYIFQLSIHFHQATLESLHINSHIYYFGSQLPVDIVSIQKNLKTRKVNISVSGFPKATFEWGFQNKSSNILHPVDIQTQEIAYNKTFSVYSTTLPWQGIYRLIAKNVIMNPPTGVRTHSDVTYLYC